MKFKFFALILTICIAAWFWVNKIEKKRLKAEFIETFAKEEFLEAFTTFSNPKHNTRKGQYNRFILYGVERNFKSVKDSIKYQEFWKRLESYDVFQIRRPEPDKPEFIISSFAFGLIGTCNIDKSPFRFKVTISEKVNNWCIYKKNETP